MLLNNAPIEVQKEVLSCILTLNKEFALQMCTSLNLYDIIEKEEIDIVDVVLLFQEYEIPLHIATDSSIWEEFINSIVNETGKKLLTFLKQFITKLNELLLFRAC